MARMASEKEEFVAVPFEWTFVSPDPVQYKPYNPQFRPLGMIVWVRIPTRLLEEDVPTKPSIKIVAGDTVGVTTLVHLTPKAMAYACKQLASAVMSAHTGA